MNGDHECSWRNAVASTAQCYRRKHRVEDLPGYHGSVTGAPHIMWVTEWWWHRIHCVCVYGCGGKEEDQILISYYFCARMDNNYWLLSLCVCKVTKKVICTKTAVSSTQLAGSKHLQQLVNSRTKGIPFILSGPIHTGWRLKCMQSMIVQRMPLHSEAILMKSMNS